MLLFIISTVNINYAQHMKFNGISMGETPTVFISKLKAKGFTPSYYSDNILTGKFCNENCIIVILINKDVVTSTYVTFPELKKWKYLENKYNYLKSLLIQKYGDPIECIEEFYGYSEDDSSKLLCLEVDKCKYYSRFMVDGGHIVLNIEHQGGNYNVVSLFYSDVINTTKNEQLIIEDL